MLKGQNKVRESNQPQDCNDETIQIQPWQIKQYVLINYMHMLNPQNLRLWGFSVCMYLSKTFEASEYACSWARCVLLFVAVGSMQFLHCSLEVVYFLWPCFGLSTFHTCYDCLQMIGLMMRSVTWNQSPIKNLWLTPCFFHLWSEVTWIQIRASLNHHK